MCLTAIANLRQESVKDGSNKILFSKDREIIPYIDQYWEAMTTIYMFMNGLNLPNRRRLAVRPGQAHAEGRFTKWSTAPFDTQPIVANSVVLVA